MYLILSGILPGRCGSVVIRERDKDTKCPVPTLGSLTSSACLSQSVLQRRNKYEADWNETEKKRNKLLYLGYK